MVGFVGSEYIWESLMSKVSRECSSNHLAGECDLCLQGFNLQYGILENADINVEE